MISAPSKITTKLHQLPAPLNQAQKTAGIVLLAAGALAVAAGVVATVAFAHGPFAQALNLNMLKGTLLGRNIVCGCFGAGVVLLSAGGALLYEAGRSLNIEQSLPLLAKELYKSPFPLEFWSLEDDIKEIYVRERNDASEQKNNGAKTIDLTPLKAGLLKAQAHARNQYSLMIESMRASSYPNGAHYIAKLEEALQSIHSNLQAKLDFIERMDIPEVEPQTFDDALSDPYQPITLHERTLIEIEEGLGIRENMRQLLNHVLDGIMCNDPNWQRLKPGVKNEALGDPRALKIGLRRCRQFFCDRDAYRHGACGKKDGGLHGEVFSLLKSMLYPQAAAQIKHLMYGVEVNQNYMTLSWEVGEGAFAKSWVQAFYEVKNGHSLLHVYSNAHGEPCFVELDNMRLEKPKTLLGRMGERLSNGSNWTPLILPIPNPDAFTLPALHPNPETWILPQWERNNCFFAVALVGMALIRFYDAQK